MTVIDTDAYDQGHNSTIGHVGLDSHGSVSPLLDLPDDLFGSLARTRGVHLYEHAGFRQPERRCTTETGPLLSPPPGRGVLTQVRGLLIDGLLLT